MKTVSLKSSFAIYLWHNLLHTQTLHRILDEEGFLNITSIVWDKVNTVRYGGEVRAKTCEFETYARIGEVKSLCFDKYDGLEPRPNIALLPGVASYYLYDGEKKNSTEKPVSLAAHWLGCVGTVGSTVFVPCAGTGSEVLAALKLKRNVVAVEG